MQAVDNLRSPPHGNQITVVAFQPVQLAQASFLQKSNVAKWFFDICNTEMAQIFHVKKLKKVF